MSTAYRRARRFTAALITLLCAGSLLSPAAEPLSEGRYKINAAESRFTVRALVGGLLSSVAGHDHTIAIRDFYGAAQFTYGSVTPASLQFTIRADSLAVTDKVSESDRNKIQTTMRNEVLDVNSYPEITFKSTEITATRVEEGKYETRITGDLTLHGTTRQLTINAFVTFYATSLHADGQFALRQTEYGIRPVSVAGGTIKVKDELKFSFHIVAER